MLKTFISLCLGYICFDRKLLKIKNGLEISEFSHYNFKSLWSRAIPLPEDFCTYLKDHELDKGMVATAHAASNLTLDEHIKFQKLFQKRF